MPMLVFPKLKGHGRTPSMQTHEHRYLQNLKALGKCTLKCNSVFPFQFRPVEIPKSGRAQVELGFGCGLEPPAHPSGTLDESTSST